MMQKVENVTIAVTCIIILFDTVAEFMGISGGSPIVNVLCFAVIIMYILHNGRINRMEYEEKRKVYLQKKAEAKRLAFLKEYEEFRKEMHSK